MHEEATITSKGQVTIPKDIRKHLGLREGEKTIFIERTGEVIIRPKITNSVQKFRELRAQIKFSEKEIENMIKESKKAWD